jgi:hypothetical protein
MLSNFVKTYKYFILVNTWFYSMYIIIGKIGVFLYDDYGAHPVYNIEYLITAMAITATFCMAYTFNRIRVISGFGTRIMSISLYIIGILSFIALNTSKLPIDGIYMSAQTPSTTVTIAGSGAMVILGLLSVLAVRDLISIIKLLKQGNIR